MNQSEVRQKEKNKYRILKHRCGTQKDGSDVLACGAVKQHGQTDLRTGEAQTDRFWTGWVRHRTDRLTDRWGRDRDRLTDRVRHRQTDLRTGCGTDRLMDRAGESRDRTYGQ